jgi:hypothetical protein
MNAGANLTDANSVTIELVMGQHNTSSTKKMTAFTKWCPPENGITTFENAEAAVDLALTRMKQPKIDLLQCKLSFRFFNFIFSNQRILILFSQKITHGITQTPAISTTSTISELSKSRAR